jgi:hypothetical protein
VTVKGSLPKLLGMLPAITPAFERYRAYCLQHPVAAGM